MQDELLSKLGEMTIPFHLHRQQFETTKTKIRQGTQMLRRYAGVRAREGCAFAKA